MKRIQVTAIKDWSDPSLVLDVVQVSARIGYSKDPDNKGKYSVTHIPTGAAIFKNKRRTIAIKLAREIAKSDGQWDFTDKSGFMQKRDELSKLRDAASSVVGD